MQEQTEELVQEETIMKKMQKVEDALQDSLHRVSVLENRLKTKLLTIENRERIETELEEVKEVLRKNEEKLQSLRRQNTKSFMKFDMIVTVESYSVSNINT
ncbi:uncharacterized protein LOC143211777 isoform X2 [Lasioglossum baleicum]|uniref:uncharacterized protein LOC143211777 isoform X2 n=1 Tax=Lasioglossum baleicum TaxID=434251 RepID=UPI003FCD4D97